MEISLDCMENLVCFIRKFKATNFYILFFVWWPSDVLYTFEFFNRNQIF